MDDQKQVSANSSAMNDPLPPEKEALVMKIVAICWEQFGRGAKIDVDPRCFDKAVELGALENLRTRLKGSNPFTEAELKSAKWCSLKAGHEARKLARKLPPSTCTVQVTPDMYAEAFRIVSDKNDKLNIQRKSDDLFEIAAVWCP